MFPHWPDEVEDTITRSVKTAEAKALLTIKMLGMDRSLLTPRKYFRRIIRSSTV